MRLSPDLHADLRLTPIDNTVLASRSKAAALLIPDIQPLATRFPIVVVDEGNLLLKALIPPSDTENLFAEYIPLTWRNYPMILASMLDEDHPLQASTPGVRELSPSVVIHEDAIHFQLTDGFKLFEAGEPTPFLTERIQQLQVLAEEEIRTEDLLDLLERAGVLEPAKVVHLGEEMDCYLVNDKALSTNLDKVAKEGDSIGQAISLALAIAASQKHLEVTRST